MDPEAFTDTVVALPFLDKFANEKNGPDMGEVVVRAWDFDSGEVLLEENFDSTDKDCIDRSIKTIRKLAPRLHVTVETTFRHTLVGDPA